VIRPAPRGGCGEELFATEDFPYTPPSTTLEIWRARVQIAPGAGALRLQPRAAPYFLVVVAAADVVAVAAGVVEGTENVWGPVLADGFVVA